ncbi:MAG: hypothetical protein H7144_07555, partial [Burkholderiales bacterium]|nr:hypothetical protein [Phycisphaerae bacterium]
MSLEHWLTLSLSDGIGPILARRIIDAAGSVAAACEVSESVLRGVDGIGAQKVAKIAGSIAAARATAAAEIEAARAKGIGFLTPDEPAYPHLLTTIPNPPL